jgi:hypothetical protein
VEPFPFGEMQSIVYTGVPPMLPPEYPVEEGTPEIVAYILTSDEGEYEVSLVLPEAYAFAVDCHTLTPDSQGSGILPFEGLLESDYSDNRKPRLKSSIPKSRFLFHE